MRLLLLLCLGSVLLAQAPGRDLPQPGRNAAFLAQIQPETRDPEHPWHLYRVPEGSAVVEVVGELTPAEVRRVAFQDFLIWFQADLRAFLRERLNGDGGVMTASLPAAGGPGPLLVPLGGFRF